MKHIVKVFVYGSRVQRHRYVSNPRPQRLVVCLLYIPLSEMCREMDQVKTLATTGAKMEKASGGLQK